jgi:hypothetical protein
MKVHYRQIEPFDVTNINEINRNLLRREMRLRSYPTAVVTRWKHYVHPGRFRVYFFDDLQINPTQLRRSILDFLGADPDKPIDQARANHNSWARHGKAAAHEPGAVASGSLFFKKELKACSARLGGQPKNGRRATAFYGAAE